MASMFSSTVSLRPEFENGFDVFLDGQLAEDRRFLGQVRQPEPCAPVDRHVGEIVCVERHAAAVRRDQPHHHVEAGGLARTVGAEQADDFAAADFERHVVYDGAPAVGFFQALGDDAAHGLAAGSSVRGFGLITARTRPAGVWALG